MRRVSTKLSIQGVIFSSIFLVSFAIPSIARAQTSPWAELVNGTLTYEQTSNGDHIMDFSSAGYNGGGVALPTSFTVVQTLSPSGGDDTSAIQAKITSVGNLIKGTTNTGEVVLAAGTFHVSSTITITESGVVLSGSGSGSGGTIVQWTGATGSYAFQIGQAGAPTTSNTVNLTQSYIPSGSTSVTVSSTSGFSVNQEVLITRPVTASWISYMGMTATTGDQMWMCPSDGVDPLGGTCTPAVFTTDRTITEINASTNTITFNAPITDSFNSAYLGSPVGTLSIDNWPSVRIQQAGLQHLEILAPIVLTSTGSELYGAVHMQNVVNGWIYDVVGQETQNAFTIDQNTRQVTLEKVINNLSTAQTAGAGSADFAVTGTQIFVDNCQSNGSGDWPLLTQSGGTGPIAVLNFSSTQHGGIGGHQRWTTGLLVDNAILPYAPSDTPGIVFLNRGLGVGQGWAMGWGVAWNVTTPYTTVATPPGAENWCIGCQGTPVSNASSTPNGIYSSSLPVTPSSLYLEQLKERLGQGAVNAIGYSYYPSLGSWMDLDIGAPGVAGSVSYGGGVTTVSGSGADIYGTSDQFNYVYQPTTSTSFTIQAEVTSQTNTNSWAKAGVMIRESTAAGAAYAGVYVTPGEGVSFQYRATTNASATNGPETTGLTAPYWVRLVRNGSTFTAYTAPDGITWTELGSATVTMANYATMGLAVSSHNNSEDSTVTFANVDSAPSGVPYNVDAAYTDGATFSASGGIDGGGHALSATLMGSSAMGSSVTWNGTTLQYGFPNQLNGLSSVTIPLAPGSFSSLNMLALAINGDQTAQVFTVTYSDGTQSTYTQSVSDWGTPQSYTGESRVVTMSYRDTYTGTKASGTFYIYGYTIPTNSSKTVTSLTLPSNSHIVVLAVQDLQ